MKGVSGNALRVVGACIYCGATEPESKLTDEHIVPYFLGGDVTIAKGSCTACARIINSQIENRLARQKFGRFLAKFDVQTRNPNRRPTSVQIGIINDDGVGEKISIPIAESPTIFIMYKFHRANSLNGFGPDVGIFGWTPYIVHTCDLNEFKKKFKWDGMVRLLTMPVEFARLIAKIGYSFAISQLGIGVFKPLCIDIILGKTNKVSYLVGGRYLPYMTSIVSDLEPPIQNGGHLLSIDIVPDLREKRVFVVTNVRLFAYMANATYHVVVGELALPNQNVRLQRY